MLDPTCGSGAFLFAALEHPGAALRGLPGADAGVRRRADRSGGEPHQEVRGLPRDRWTRSERHPNRDYFILKSIIVNNLYGVDIMEEAVEICKLRLFLKLVAQVETPAQIEPLPDIDFNIRAGNTLVGFATRESVQQALTTAEAGQVRLLGGRRAGALAELEERAEIADRAFERFHQLQADPPKDDTSLPRRSARFASGCGRWPTSWTWRWRSSTGSR